LLRTGILPDRSTNPAATCARIVAGGTIDAVKRLDVEFASEQDTCAAWLYVPDGNGPFAAVVLAHGWTGVREQRLDAYAARFADVGLPALVFDYRQFGARSGEPRPPLDL